MNIFVLDETPQLAAQYQVDKHVVKMVLETAQLLSTAHAVLDGVSPGYKPTHRNHPSAVWVRESQQNYMWLVDHLKALCAEYTYRYDKTHKTESLVPVLECPPKNIPSVARTPFALAMPDIYRVSCPVESYRAYYRDAKKDLHSWKRRTAPFWITIP